MNREIYRNRVPVYNKTKNIILSQRPVNVGKILLENPTEYTVAVESASFDMTLAAFDTSPEYKIIIFCELKEDTTPPAPAGLVYGANVFSFSGELHSVAEFLHFLQDPLLKKALPFNLGLFDLDHDKMFKYFIDPTAKTAVFDSGYFKVYFNESLAEILTGFCNQNDSITHGGEAYFELVPVNRTSENDTLPKLNKIESILITTTLPVTPTGVLTIDQNQVIDYSLIGSTEMNNVQYNMLDKTGWKYIPNLLRPYTLAQLSPITQYEVGILLQYKNSDLRQHYLKPRESFAVNLVFSPHGVAV